MPELDQYPSVEMLSWSLVSMVITKTGPFKGHLLICFILHAWSFLANRGRKCHERYFEAGQNATNFFLLDRGVTLQLLGSTDYSGCNLSSVLSGLQLGNQCAHLKLKPQLTWQVSEILVIELMAASVGTNLLAVTCTVILMKFARFQTRMFSLLFGLSQKARRFM